MSDMTLADLNPEESGLVIGLEGKGMLAQRLVDMGLYPGVAAKVVRRAPLGDPIEVDAEGALVNLRREEARFVKVKKI
ncbi:FeoA family protein [Fretibacterium sp. OH1220_COT-178]|uniref:FeoA family protein n=1 Tax=Fretibacterium sp. OH1220_COT-178 TaxID=2491047 RepID=UPI000F5F5F95|nr:FeoA family protein [Fretibacterium sp. OH1220_COT-178]RRD65294.1 ferrous iron transport protein A [Fretibacterium sp. OH1220_COT-178]